MVIARQTQVQSFLSLAVFMLLVCYYTFNGVPEDSFRAGNFATEKSAEYNNSLMFEKNVSQLRAAILMDADIVQVNGLLYQLELATADLSTTENAKKQIQKIYNLLQNNDKKAAIKSINRLRTQLILWSSKK